MNKNRKPFGLFKKLFKFYSGLYGSIYAAMAMIVDLELKKREATTSAVEILTRSLITCKRMFSSVHLFTEKMC